MPPPHRWRNSTCSEDFRSKRRAPRWGSLGRWRTGTGNMRGPGSATHWENNSKSVRHFSPGWGIEGAQPQVCENLSSAVQGQFSYFFSGMPAASFRSQSADSLDTVQRAWPAAGQGLFTSRDRGSLRTDPRQSRSGNSSLSPRACRVEPRPPNWPYGRLDRSPLPMPLETTVGAPLRARRF